MTKSQKVIRVRNAYKAGLITEAQMDRRVAGIVRQHPHAEHTPMQSKLIIVNLMHRAKGWS